MSRTYPDAGCATTMIGLCATHFLKREETGS